MGVMQLSLLLALIGQATCSNTLGVLPPPPTLSSVSLLAPSPPPGGSDSIDRTDAHPASVSWAADVPQLTPSLAQTPQPVFHGIPTPPAAVIPPPGLSLSPATEPFPQKLVARVRSGQFVELRDMLTDNIALLQQMETFTSTYACMPGLPGVLKPRLRDITSLASWMYCFMAYIAMRVTDPAARDLLAYARLVIREAQRHGGTGWMNYDRVFRQQAAIDATLRWNTIHPGIQAATLVGQAQGTAASMCTLCREPDHTAAGCALAYLQQPVGQAPPTAAGPTRTSLPSGPPARSRYATRRRQDIRAICTSWNRGKCVYPSWCNFRHICATCQGGHMARDCSTTPADSDFKRGLSTPGRKQAAASVIPKPGQ